MNLVDPDYFFEQHRLRAADIVVYRAELCDMLVYFDEDGYAQTMLIEDQDLSRMLVEHAVAAGAPIVSTVPPDRR